MGTKAVSQKFLHASVKGVCQLAPGSANGGGGRRCCQNHLPPRVRRGRRGEVGYGGWECQVGRDAGLHLHPHW